MKIKKLSAFIAGAMLAVSATPTGAVAENFVEKDGHIYMAMLDGTILDTDEKYEKFCNEFFNDTTGRGDVNHDGSVDAVDATMILEYFACLATDKYDTYTEEEHENFRKYGDVFNDGVINPLDASWVLSKYAEKSTTE